MIVAPAAITESDAQWKDTKMFASLRNSTHASHRGFAALSGLFARIPQIVSMRRQQRALSLLDDHLLSDVGLTRAQALKEAARPIWDAPHGWRG